MNWLEKLTNGSQNTDVGDDTVVIQAPPQLDTINDERVETPKDYNVLLHNDDHTPFNVVVDVLKEVFDIAPDRAMSIMMAAHNNGTAVVATMSKDMAETKAVQAMEAASRETNPVTGDNCMLQFSTEEA